MSVLKLSGGGKLKTRSCAALLLAALLSAMAALSFVACGTVVGGSLPTLNNAERQIAGMSFSGNGMTYTFNEDKTGIADDGTIARSARAVGGAGFVGNFEWSAEQSGSDIAVTMSQGGRTESATVNPANATLSVGEQTFGLADIIVTEMNLVRKNPADYAAKYITPMLSDQNALNTFAKNEGKTVVQELINTLNGTSGLRPFTESAGLRNAARDHATEQGQKGTMDHNSANGDTFDVRIKKYGSGSSSFAENIATGYTEARQIVIQLLLDDGVQSRGHRKNILSPEYAYAGSYTAASTNTSIRNICVIDFAGSGFTTNAGVQNVTGSLSDKLPEAGGSGASGEIIGTKWTGEYQFGLWYAMYFKDASTVMFGHCGSAEQALKFAQQPVAANCTSQESLNYTYDSSTGIGTLSGAQIPGVIGDGKFELQAGGKLITKDSGWGGNVTFTQAN